MKLLLIFILSIGLYAGQRASEPIAPSGFYVETNIDYPSTEAMEFDNVKYNFNAVLTGAVAIGYQMDRWRFELEGNYSKDDIAELVTETTSDAVGELVKKGGLVNVYYSAYNDSQLVSSIGAGAGVTNIDAKDVQVNATAVDDASVKNSLTYQATVSLGYMVDADWTWTVKYRYLNIDDLKSSTQTFSLGLRYLF